MAKKFVVIIMIFGALSVVSADSLSTGGQPDQIMDAIVNGQKTIKYESGMTQPDGQINPDSAAVGISASNGRFSIGIKKPLKENSKLLVNLGIQSSAVVNSVATKSSINLGHDQGGDYIGAKAVKSGLGLGGKLYLDGSYRVGLEADLMSKANIRSLLENDYIAVKTAKIGSYYNSFQQETLSVEADLKVKPKQKEFEDVVISAHFAEHYNTDNKGGGDDYKISVGVSVGYTWGGKSE